MLVGISHKWYDIGLQLKVKPNVLNRIQSQYSDPAVCLRMTLSDWLIGISPYPTWEALAKALESRSVKEDRLAKKVRETLIVSVTTTHPAPAPPTAHPIQQMASTRAEVVADPAYHPSIHTYTPAEYNPAYNPIAPTPSQHSAQLHPYDLEYFTRIPTAMSSGPPQLPRVPIPSFPTHSYQQTTPTNNSHTPMAMNPASYPSHGPYSVPPHPHYGYTQNASTPPQPHQIPSDAVPKLAPMAPDLTYYLPTQRLSPLAYPIPSAATPIQDPMDPTYCPPTQRPPTHAPLPPYTADLAKKLKGEFGYLHYTLYVYTRPSMDQKRSGGVGRGDRELGGGRLYGLQGTWE